jgi:hypothetical protein
MKKAHAKRERAKSFYEQNQQVRARIKKMRLGEVKKAF